MIKLSNGVTYSIYDEGALRLDSNHNLITGNTVVDDIIIKQGFRITHIDDVALADVQTKVLVAQQIGTDDTTGKAIYGYIKQQDIRQVLKNLGLITAEVEGTTLNLMVVDFNGSV